MDAVLNKPNIFKVGNFSNGETNFCSLGENVVSIGDIEYKVSILDTLGLGAEITKGGLSEDDCIKKIKEGLDQHKDVKCIALVHNCTMKRMTNDENKMLNIYIRMLPPQEIWKNICIIYSNFDCSKDEEDKKEIMDNLNDPNEGFTSKFTNKLKEAIELRNKELPDNQKVDLKKMEGQKIKTFFMDSKTKNLEKNKQSVEESHRLIKWASDLQYLDLNAVSLIITQKIPEEEEYLLNTKEEDIHAIKTYIRRKREKKINKLGKVSYSEWEEIPGSKREIKEELENYIENREHFLIKSYEEDKYLVKCYQSQSRTVYIKSDGSKIPLEWKNVGNVDIEKTKLQTYYKSRPTISKGTKSFGKTKIKFYQKRRKKVYIHNLNGKDYESTNSSDDGNIFSSEEELTPTIDYEYEKRKIHRNGNYEITIDKGNKGLRIAGAVSLCIPVIGLMPGIIMGTAGAEKTKTIYKYKQEKYKRKISTYPTGYIEKGDWVFDGYDYFENSDSEYLFKNNK